MILNESISSIIRQVDNALKEDSRMGDLISLVNSDKEELNMNITDEEIAMVSKGRIQLKNLVVLTIKP